MTKTWIEVRITTHITCNSNIKNFKILMQLCNRGQNFMKCNYIYKMSIYNSSLTDSPTLSFVCCFFLDNSFSFSFSFFFFFAANSSEESMGFFLPAPHVLVTRIFPFPLPLTRVCPWTLITNSMVNSTTIKINVAELQCIMKLLKESCFIWGSGLNLHSNLLYWFKFTTI